LAVVGGNRVFCTLSQLLKPAVPICGISVGILSYTPSCILPVCVNTNRKQNKISVCIPAEELELIYLMGMFMKLFSDAARKIFAAIVKRSGKKISSSCN
jgi:hypothetical protein